MTTLNEIKIGSSYEFIYNELDENKNLVTRWQRGIVKEISSDKIKTSNGVLWTVGILEIKEA